MHRKRENHLLPYPLIVSATKGDPDAIRSVRDHFGGYITTLCKGDFHAERGGDRCREDSTLRRRLENKLVKAILTFDAG